MAAIYMATFVLLSLGACAVFTRRGHELPMPACLVEATTVVTFDDEAIVVRYPGAESRSMQWKELGKVGIRTTDEGPFAPDVFWGLHDQHGAPRLVYPSGATGEGEFLSEMQRRLAGFDDRQVIAAMGSTSHAFFLVWKNDAGQPGSYRF